MTSRAARRLALVALAIGVSGCGGDGDTGVEYPPTHGVFDYQLGGTYGRISTPDGESRIDIVVRPGFRSCWADESPEFAG